MRSAIPHVEQGIAPTCSNCGSPRGLWDEDGNQFRYCGNCGAELSWNLVEDGDADDTVREPFPGELDPPVEPTAAPREEYQAVGLALANELRALSVRCLALATAVAETDDIGKLGDDGFRRMAAGLALDLAAWGDMKMPLERIVNPFANRAAEFLNAHPGEWRLDDDGHVRDLRGAPVEVPPDDLAVLLVTLRNTERDSRWKLDDARREVARLRRHIKKMEGGAK